MEDIRNWANDRSLASLRVFWLTGQAGSGKTTILYTIAKEFEGDVNAKQHTTLGANFFCSRQFQETQGQTRILPTLAYQLARKCKSYANALHVADKFNAVNHVHEISTVEGSSCWLMSEVTCNPELSPYLIVIDALDEIKDHKGPAFLSKLMMAINGENDLRGFKFLVMSRPDPKVAGLCKSFPSELSVVCKTCRLKRHRDISENAAARARARYNQESRQMLNDFLSKSYEPASSGGVTSLVDELCRRIVFDASSKLSGKILGRQLQILYTFLCTAERSSAPVVAGLVSGDEAAARAVLQDLRAVLYTQDDRVFRYHASFLDFIFTEARSNFSIDKKDFKFSCNEAAHQGLLGESCFRIMEAGLRFNMGNISSSFLFNDGQRRTGSAG